MKLYFENFIKEDASGHLHPVPSDFSFNVVPGVIRDLKKLGLLEEDLKDLENHIKSTIPKSHIGYGIHKAEWWPNRFNQGKKEARVIYIEITLKSAVWIVKIYKKNQQKDVSKKELAKIIQVAKKLKE